MNIIVYTVSMLMILGIIGYNSFHKYIDNITTQRVYLQFMDEAVRGYSNEVEGHKYRSFSNSKKSGRQPDEGKKVEETKNPRLNLAFIFEKQRAAPVEQDMATNLLKRLCYNLFHEEDFFVHAEKQYPDILDRIIEQLITKADHLKLVRAQDIANIDLEDQELQEIYYKMLTWQGLGRQGKGFGLMDMLGFHHNSSGDIKKLWVYYAPYPLLEALLGDQQAAQECADFRVKFYHQDVGEAQEHWEEEREFLEDRWRQEMERFLALSGNLEYAELLNFGIKKTVPPPL
ncbi:MAG: hypothetical protein ACQEP8_03770 [Chlamydiota bacterium]